MSQCDAPYLSRVLCMFHQVSCTSVALHISVLPMLVLPCTVELRSSIMGGGVVNYHI